MICSRLRAILIVCLIAFVMGIVLNVSCAQESRVLEAGWVEWVTLGDQRHRFEAKLDTGADTSSLHAIKIREIVKSGRQHIEFLTLSKKAGAIKFVAPFVRYALIRRHGLVSAKRPVVLLPVCLGGVRRNTEFSLVDRSKFQYRVLIGRSFLSGLFSVRSGLKHIVKPNCD